MSTTTDVAHLRDFRPDQDNARLHDERNLAAIETSMQTTGFGRPILAAKDGTVLAGNATLEAAGNIGMEEVILVHSDGTKPIIHVRTDLDPNSEMARLAAFYDNRTAELASWDTEVLAALMQEVDIAAVAMTPEEAADLIAAAGPAPVVGNTDPDAVPEPPVEPTTRPGDLWRLGEHRVMCGDSTKAEDVVRLMANERAEMVWTDPPYGVAIGDKNKMLNTIGTFANRVERNLENDTIDEISLEAMLRLAFGNAAEHCTAGAAWYVAAPAGPLHIIFGQALKDMGIWRQTIQWVKNNATFSPLGVCYHWQAEPIFFGWKPGAAHRYYGGRTQTTVWEIDRPSKSPDHPTMKPVELVDRAIANSSQVGELVLDPFLGSGTTLIAAEQLGRRCYGMEIDPVYADVIVRRWEQFTGGTAELEQAP